MRSLKTENQALYEICTALYNDQEKYGELDIYNEVIEAKKSRMKVGNAYVSHSDSGNIHILYNQLKKHFEFLFGMDKREKKEDQVLGEGIRPMLDIELLNLHQRIVLLNEIYCLRLEKNANKRRYFVSFLKKIDIDKSINLLNEVIEKLVGSEIQDITNSKKYEDRELSEIRKELYKEDTEKMRKIFLEENKEFVSGLSEWEKRDFRDKEIPKRNTAEKLEAAYDLYNAIFKGYYLGKSLNDVYRYARECLIEGKDHPTFKRQEEWYPQFGKLKKYYYVWIYINICCYCILQYVVKEIQYNHGIPSILRSKLNDLVQEVLMETMTPVKPTEDVDECLFQLVSFYYRKDYFLQNVRIRKYIEVNCENEQTQCYISEESKNERELSYDEIMALLKNDFKEKKRIKNENKRQSLNYKKMILELDEENVTDRAFQENYEQVRKDIAKFCCVSARNIPSDLIHTKAFYRSIYLDKTLFGRRTTRQIFNDVINEKPVPKADAYYLNEKINMAICRETGNLKEYFELTEFQEQLYFLVCVSLARLNPDEVLKKFEGFFNPLRDITENK